MRVVFMGTPDFAAESLRAVLDAGYEVAGVFTQPDKPKGRGMKFAECETKRLALSRGLDVYQPASVRTPEALELIKRGSRRYAKRQISWCGRYGDALRINWEKTPDFDEALRLSTSFWKQLV